LTISANKYTELHEIRPGTNTVSHTGTDGRPEGLSFLRRE